MSLRHVLAAALCLSTALAAAPQDPELKIPLTGDKLTVSGVEARTQKLRDDKALPEATKTPLLSAYGDALAALQEAAKARATLDKLNALKSEAAQKRESFKQQMAMPARKPTAEALKLKGSDVLAVDLQQAQTASGAATRRLQLLDEEIRTRAERQKTLPQQIVAAEQKLREAEERVQAASALKENPFVVAAQQTLAAARQRQASIELDALKAEQNTSSLADELAKLEREVVQKQESEARELVELLRGVVLKRQQDEAEEAAREARMKARTENEALKKLATETADYANRRAALIDRLGRAQDQLQEVEQERKRIEKSFKDSQSDVRKWGLTELLGDSLRRERAKLPSPQSYRAERQRWAAENKQIFAQLRAIEALPDSAEVVASALAAGKGLDEASLRAEAEELFKERQRNVDEFSKYANQLSQKLWELETASLSLLALVEDFEAFLDEKILWIRSNIPLWSIDWNDSLRDWHSALVEWSDLGAAARAGFSSAGVWVLLLLLLAVLARIFKPRLRRYRDDLGARAAKGSTRTFGPTLATLVVTLALALPMALALLAGWQLFRSVTGWQFPSVDAARAFRWTASFLFLVNLLREIASPRGLAENHFRWSQATARLLRRSMVSAALFGAPLLWLVMVCGQTGNARLLGRGAFVAGMVLTLLIAWRLFRPSSGLLSPTSGLVLTALVGGVRTSIFLLAVMAPIALASLNVSGYSFTAVQLSARLLTTLGLLMALLVFSALITRWRLVTKRALLVEQRRQQLQAQRQAAEQAGEEVTTEPSLEQLDVVQVDTQTRKLIATVLVVVGLLGVFAIWAGVFPALSFREIELWSVDVSLADLILSLFTVVLTIVAALNLPGFLKLTLFRRMKPGNQYAAATLVQYGIVVVGIVLSFGLIGIGWSKVQWLVAAVSLGLGFGLQEIFANFVSGLILLFEQPIRVGDFITVGDSRGEVTRIRIRATTIRNLDRQELVVPNKEFITGRVVNWTLSDSINRITVLVGIAYGSNVELAHETLLKVAHDNHYIVAEPKPKVMFKEFGDSALVFELRVYIATLDDWVKATHSIHAEIDRAFRKAGIVIAFPQRDLHVKTVEEPLPFEMRGSEQRKKDTDAKGA